MTLDFQPLKIAAFRHLGPLDLRIRNHSVPMQNDQDDQDVQDDQEEFGTLDPCSKVLKT